MRVKVGDIRLFVEVVGKKLSISNAAVESRPTIVLLHGGPAWDHLTLLPDFEALSDVAQLIFYDHRGLGRSDFGSPETWNLRQWARDLKSLLETFGVERPVVLGQSFGGMVAQQFALDYPDDYSGLILSSTAARIDLEGIVENFRSSTGDEAARLVRSFFTSSGSAADRAEFTAKVLPTYTRSKKKIGALSAYLPHVSEYFFSDAGDARRFDFRNSLGSIRAPTLILGGDSDPVVTPSAVWEMANSFSPRVATTKIFDECGHGPARDCPQETLSLIRSFIADRVVTAAKAC